MPKAKRLMELMMAVNRKRQFKVRELADEFGVSTRTILRDLQELSELGVPLYSEVGPHGGYRILRERVLPPIAFTEVEAVAMFFASHALRHYSSLPFEVESVSALRKFYLHLPGDVRDSIDRMKHRLDFTAPTRRQHAPYLPILLEAAVSQQILHITYEPEGKSRSTRPIQPVFIYTNQGFWYCSAYCFLRNEYRLFRCDRIVLADYDTTGLQPLELEPYQSTGWYEEHLPQHPLRIRAHLSHRAVQRCEGEIWISLDVQDDGSGYLEKVIPEEELSFYAEFCIGLGKEVAVEGPEELKEEIRKQLAHLTSHYAK
ncbi:helix-turn-helix transcriptional regulator [Paenibacillus kandeliae]|uniref:helix-turn-helix transcriptional regulator n=1 Tax=Paenibacillus kandeliae TaxID=3231269 RepID=UPI003457E09E